MADRKPKVCEECGDSFVRPRYSATTWARVRYCSTTCAIAAKILEPYDRFLRHIDPEPTERGCILWIGALANEYGHFLVGTKNKKAHIFAYEHEHGPIPDGLRVLHKCDTPLCVNVAHLWLGTQAENLADMRAKGRGARGAKCSSTKLTEDQVRLIRKDFRSYAKIAAAYGVSITAISALKNGKTWVHVMDVPTAVEERT